MGRATSPRAANANDDERFVAAVEQYDEYLADQQHAIELLKQGFLKLTMAKMNLPAHAVSELSYKDEFEAALYVVEESDGSLVTIKASDRQAAKASSPSSSSSTTTRRKGAASSAQETASTKPAAVSNGREEDASIMWFSSLPPANLRLAQKHFRSALQALLVSAASVRTISRTSERTSSN